LQSKIKLNKKIYFIKILTDLIREFIIGLMGEYLQENGKVQR